VKNKGLLLFSIVSVLLLSCTISKINVDASIDRSAWTWNDTMVATIDSDMPCHYPEVAVDTEGNVHVTWEESTGGYNIYYAMLDAQTQTWGNKELVTPDSTGIPDRPFILTDHQDNIHIFFMDDTDYYGTSGGDHDICHSVKNYGETSWSAVEVISTESTLGSYIPVAAIDDSGDIHVAYYDSTDYLSCGSDIDVFYKKYHASSSSWGIAEVVSTESDDLSGVPSICVSSDGEVFIAWTDDSTFDSSGSDQDIFFKSRSLTGDWTYTSVLTWLSDGYSTQIKLACDKEGIVHAVWYDDSPMLNSGGDADIFYSTYDSELHYWTSFEVITDMCVLTSSNPDITADVFGDIHVIWHDSTPYGGSNSDADIMYRIKDSSTQTWSQEMVVSVDNDDNSYYPEIATDSNGFIHIIWQDAMDYLGCGSEYDVFYRKFSGTVVDTEAGLFKNLDFGEIIILAGILGGFQIILAVITYFALRKKK